jgi:hypothetical protein
MDENNIFQEPVTQPAEGAETAAPDGKKPMDTAALVLGIVAVAAAAFIPLVSYVCGVIGLVFAIRHRKAKRTTVALILCIVGIVGGIVSNVIAARVVMEALGPMLESLE